MPGLVLRVKSSHFDAEKFLSDSHWEPEVTWPDGFNLLISEAEEFRAQVADALDFLLEYEFMLKKLANQTNSGSIELDFGSFAPEGPSASVSFNSEAIRCFAKHGIDVRVSTYVPSAT